MRYVTSIERLAKEEGVQVGSLQSAQGFVQEVLETRFGYVPDSIKPLLKRVGDSELLRQLLRLAITVESLSTFEQRLSEMVQEPA